MIIRRIENKKKNLLVFYTQRQESVTKNTHQLAIESQT